MKLETYTKERLPKTDTNIYRSGLERQTAAYLHNVGMKFTYETYVYEYNEPLRKNLATCADCGSQNLMRTGHYTPDFFLENGLIIETKGRFMASDRRKMIAMKKDYPNERIAILFGRNNKLSRQSTTTYTEWCDANGYTCSVSYIGEVPDSWLVD